MIVQLRNVHRRYAVGGQEFRALDNVDVDIDEGALVFINGKSGSGKSTMLNIIAGLDRPTTGTAVVCGVPVHDCNQDELAVFRGRHIGVVFQFFQLLPTLTVRENVLLAMDFVGQIPSAKRQARTIELLHRVGVADQRDKFPSQLSGGQQQRVAIARAMANDPPLIVADEPTGNLDSQTAADIMGVFKDLVGVGKTILLVTHDDKLEAKPTQRITLVDGRVAKCVRC